MPKWIAVYFADGGKAAIRTVGGASQQMLAFGKDAELTQEQIDEVVAASAKLVAEAGLFDAGQGFPRIGPDDVAAARDEIRRWRQRPDDGPNLKLYRRVSDVCAEAARRGENRVNAIIREFTRGQNGKTPEPLSYETARRYFRTAKGLRFPCGEPHNDDWRRELRNRHLLAGRANAHQVTVVFAAACPAGRDLVALCDLFVDGDSGVLGKA